jgi:uncharacterized membrane protein
MIAIVQFISLFLLALVLGIFWGTWFSLSRSIEEISPQTFLENGRFFIKNLAAPMRILMPLTILFMIVGTVLYPFKNSPGLYLNIASLMLVILALLITVLVEVPIDNQIKKWEITTLPENWQNLRAKWQFYHTLRTFVCMGSFLLLLAGTLFYR